MKCIPHGRRAVSNASAPYKRPIPRVVVVDGRPGDYATWQSAASAGQVQLEVVGSAQDALRLCSSDSRGQHDLPDLWIVNGELADMSGFDLCAMLKDRSPRTPVYMVVDGYSLANERAAWQAKATMFVAKPGHHILLEHWLKSYTPAPHLRAASRRPAMGSPAVNRFAGSRFAAPPRAQFDRLDGLTS